MLDVLLQRYRDTDAAKRFFRKLQKKQGFVPQVIVTDKLKSYEAAKKQVLRNVDHQHHKGLNNRVENSHQPIRLTRSVSDNNFANAFKIGEKSLV